MHPLQRCMDSFPQQRNPMPYTQHYHPNVEAIPPVMKVDTSRSPLTYETWPYGGNYSHSVPMGCHGCCNPSNFPGFPGYWSFRAPYPYYPQPSPYNYHGGYPSFPGPFSVHFVPPPNYTMDQPGYEYDKNMPSGHHCCGCPNHPCSKKEDRRVKIEEQEPENEKETSSGKKSSNSLVPVDHKNQSYPIVWIPPGYMNKEQNNSTTSEFKEMEEYPHGKKPHEDLKPSQQEPRAWSGWFPFDVNSFGSLNHGGDRKTTQNQPTKDMNQFPFPIFWMPYKPGEEVERDHREEKDGKEANTGQVSAEKSPSSLKTASVQFPSSDDSMSQWKAREEKFGGEVASKSMEKNHANLKTIPVKQLEEHEEKVKTEEDEARSSGVTLKGKGDSKEKQPSEIGTKRQSSSPPKTSKLPPVCLRVDPLPRRRSGNGSSRSPSPPGHKGKAQDSENSKLTSPQEKERKVVEVVEDITTEDSGENCKVKSQPQIPVTLPIDSHEEVLTSQSPSKAGNFEEDKGTRDAEEKKSEGAIKSTDSTSAILPLNWEGNEATKAKEENPEEANKPKRKNLSEVEAAVIIQSAYRGFDVRRWDPLKKMRQIAEVKEQVAEIKSCIGALESSPDVSNDNNQMVVIGETIMSLLLKLDTVQGLHPTVRDFRKSVAKELVSLQEKLDSLTTKKSEVSTTKLVEDLPVNTGDSASIQVEQKETQIAHGNGICEGDQDDKYGSLKPCQGQDSHLKESTSASQAVKTSDLESVEKEVFEEEPQDKITASPIGSSGVGGKEEAEAFNKLEDNLDNQMLDSDQVPMLMTLIQDLELKPPVEPLLLVAEEKVDSLVDEAKLPSCLSDQLAELPGASDQLVAIEEIRGNMQNKAGICEIIQGGEFESLSEIGGASMDGEYGDMDQLQQPRVAFKEEQGTADMEYAGREGVFELDEVVRLKQAQLLTQKQGEEGRPVDQVEVPNEENEVSRKESEHVEAAGLEIKELTVQSEGEENNTTELLDTSNQQVPQPELLLEQKECYNEEVSKPDESHSELSLDEYETHSEEASKPEVPQPELLPTQNEIQSGELLVDDTIVKDDNNCWEDSKEVTIQETEGCEMESKIVVGEENEEVVKVGHHCEGQISVPGNDQVNAAQISPAGTEQLEAHGELFPMSPTASQVSEGDRKLIEENEKLREMMEKLIEAGREQLTAISNLSSKVKDLEKKLARKKKLRTKQVRAGLSCVKPSNDALKGRDHGVAA